MKLNNICRDSNKKIKMSKSVDTANWNCRNN